MSLLKITDVPPFLYIGVIFLLLLYFAYEKIYVEINSGLWNKQPKEWIQILEYNQDELPDSIVEQGFLLDTEEEESFRIAEQGFPSKWPVWLKAKGRKQRNSWAERMRKVDSDYEMSKERGRGNLYFPSPCGRGLRGGGILYDIMRKTITIYDIEHGSYA